MSTTRKHYTPSNFGTAVRQHLAASNKTQTELAASLSVSTAYVSATLTSAKSTSPRWADLIADALGVTPEERAKLHRAAALDKGYKLDLTRK